MSIAVSARLDELENNSSLIDEDIFIGSDIDIEICNLIKQYGQK